MSRDVTGKSVYWGLVWTGRSSRIFIWEFGSGLIFFLFFVWDKISPSSLLLPLTQHPFTSVPWVLSEITGYSVDGGMHVLRLVWGCSSAADCYHLSDMVAPLPPPTQQQQKVVSLLKQYLLGYGLPRFILDTLLSNSNQTSESSLTQH